MNFPMCKLDLLSFLIIACLLITRSTCIKPTQPIVVNPNT